MKDIIAFSTQKGTFTLVGRSKSGIDTYKLLGTKDFFKWDTIQVKQWANEGKIKPVSEANTIDWYKLPSKKL